MIIDNGHKENIPVGLCGEMAAEISLVMILLGLGLDEFSTSPIAVPEVKKVVRSVNFTDAQRVAEKALTMETGKEIQLYARQELKKLVPEMVTDLP
jgi:phosphotransferase system enzyme I (PtsI)